MGWSLHAFGGGAVLALLLASLVRFFLIEGGTTATWPGDGTIGPNPDTMAGG